MTHMMKFYKIVSFVFQPLLMPTFGILFLISTYLGMTYSVGWRWIAFIGSFIFTALLPALPIIMMMRRGQIKDLYISKRTANFPLFVCISCLYILDCFHAAGTSSTIFYCSNGYRISTFNYNYHLG